MMLPSICCTAAGCQLRCIALLLLRLVGGGGEGGGETSNEAAAAAAAEGGVEGHPECSKDTKGA